MDSILIYLLKMEEFPFEINQKYFDRKKTERVHSVDEKQSVLISKRRQRAAGKIIKAFNCKKENVIVEMEGLTKESVRILILELVDRMDRIEYWHRGALEIEDSFQDIDRHRPQVALKYRITF